jgi:fermentation-respiration switch protein FrsA (DUF1100 family)
MIIAILALLAAAVILGGYYFFRVLVYPNVFPFDVTREKSIEWGWVNEEQYVAWPKEEFTVRSPYGYDLAAVYHPVSGSRRTVIISHGITFSRWGSVKYAALFYKRGFNVLIYDLRHHGMSGGMNTSFGFYEKNDLKTVVTWAFERLGPGGVVGTLGESLGAATTLQHAGIDPRIAFAVADCPYSRLSDLLRLRLRADYHLPPFPLLYAADAITNRLAGWRFAQASPMRYIPRIETPIFFIHGELDTYIPPRMSVEMYQAKRLGQRKLYIAPNAGHAESLKINPVEYDEKLGEFLYEIGLEEKVEPAASYAD